MRNMIITGLLGTIVFILLTAKYPHIMLSPGDLMQGHQKIEHQCFACHQAFGGIPNTKCISCHELAAIGKDTLAFGEGKKDKVLFHTRIDQYACISCHTDHAGLNGGGTPQVFDHSLLPPSVLSECLTCHSRPNDKLHQQLTNACVKCHTTSTWKLESGFNHDMVEPSIRNKCASCHRGPDDDMHLSLKEECSKCHGTNQWLPATFDHTAYFVLDRDHNSRCSTCHVANNYRQYTCYGCHEHTVSNISEEHREEGISNFTNCVSCHKSAEEGEGEGEDD